MGEGLVVRPETVMVFDEVETLEFKKVKQLSAGKKVKKVR